MIFLTISRKIKQIQRTGLVAMILMAALANTVQAQSGTDSHLNDVSTPEDVINSITGDNEVRADAQRLAILRTLRDAIGDYKAAQGRSELTPAEREMFLAFKEAESLIKKKYDSEQPGDKRYEEFREIAFQYDKHPRDKLAIVREYAPSLAGGLAAKWGAEAQAYNDRVMAIGAKTFASFAVISFILLFIFLFIVSAVDRIQKGVNVEERQDTVTVKCRANKFGPMAAVACYPLIINVTLFLITLGFALALVFVFSGEGLITWLDTYLPLPKTATPRAIGHFIVNVFVGVLIAPWLLIVMSNILRAKAYIIKVTRKGVAAGGETFKDEDIDDIYVWSPATNERVEDPNDYVITGETTAGRAVDSGRMFRIAIGNSLALIKRTLSKLRFEVCADVGGKRRVLAKKLSSERANDAFAAVEAACNKMEIC